MDNKYTWVNDYFFVDLKNEQIVGTVACFSDTYGFKALLASGMLLGVYTSVKKAQKILEEYFEAINKM